VGQLRAMAEAGVDIGAHAYTHSNLAQVTDERQLHREVVTPRNVLQEATGHPVRYFAFPFGLQADISPKAFRLARRTGYAGVCSAYGGYNFPGGDGFHLRRLYGGNDMITFMNRVALDPRKLHSTDPAQAFDRESLKAL
jgi:peptidoglycan/xylan/chitin deacetylase (PgdA/CDA1 family)